VARSTLISEEVGDWSEGALVGSGLLSSLELDLDEVGDELLGLDVRQLDGAFDFSGG